MRIVFADMRQCTGAAVLDSCFRVAKIAAAAFTQRIKRAIAEQAVEVIGIVCFMTRKKLARLMAKKRVIAVFGLFVKKRHIFHSSTPLTSSISLSPQRRNRKDVEKAINLGYHDGTAYLF
jgi:hypothetical protein